jgi:hypothetical protein
MQSKSVRIRKDTEKRLRKFIRQSKNKVYKMHFMSDAIEEKILLEESPSHTVENNEMVTGKHWR